MNYVFSVRCVFGIGLLFIARTWPFSIQGLESDRFRKHESVHPDGVDFDEHHRIEVLHRGFSIDSTRTKNGHYPAITMTVFAFNDVFSLDLRLNSFLFAADYVEKSFDKDGEVLHKIDHADNCFYLGSIHNDASSSAAISTCSGITGYFAVGNTTYHIDSHSDRLHGPHKVYRSRSDAKTVHRCGHEDNFMDNLGNHSKHAQRMKRSFIWPQDLDKQNLIFELYIAVDHSLYLKLGSSVSAVTQRAKAIINFANAVFQPSGLYLVLVGMEVWTSGDKMTFDLTNKNVTLANWATYRKLNINPTINNDHGILFTNFSFDNGSTTGYAYVNRTCSTLYSASFISDVNPLISAVGTLVIHEIGHSFGVKHDDTINPCPCSDPSGKCIMSSVVDSISGSSLTWSQCSIDQLNIAFQQGRTLCMYNAPTMIDSSFAYCGNGIVESGEQCDCGNSTSEQCNRACCDHNTCQLVAPATCAYGRCCNINTCQIKPCGATCRAASTSCDLAELCDGNKFLCPNDTYVPDGTACNISGASAFCYEGKCQNHQSQCELIWGPGTLASENACYDYNRGGLYFANCGINWLTTPVSYISCAVSDIMCGLLQCQDLTRPLYTYKTYYNIGATTIPSSGGTCHSVLFDFGLATQNPGFVPNGAQCATGMMCVNQKCVSVSSVSTTNCNPACKTTQVCNNKGQCQDKSPTCNQITTEPVGNISICGLITANMAFFGSELTCDLPSANPVSYQWYDAVYGNVTMGRSIVVWHNGTYTCYGLTTSNGKGYIASKALENLLVFQKRSCVN